LRIGEWSPSARDDQSRGDRPLAGVDDSVVVLRLDRLHCTSRTQDGAQLLRMPRELLDQHGAPDSHSGRGHCRFSAGTIFLDEANSAEWVRSRAFEAIRDSETFEGFHGRWQHPLAAGLIGRKIPSLEHHD
jgi:hypothetical protein